MIPHDIDYLRPAKLGEAIEAWNRRPEDSLYYGGGTEIVTGFRTGSYRAGVLIDLKSVPELRSMGADGAFLFFGAALTLSELRDQVLFPLLAETVRGIADRSVRNRLTLGGNVAGRLPWREALLPFLAARGGARVAGPKEGGGLALREVPIRELHEKRLRLGKGEFLVGLSLSREAAASPWLRERAEAGASVDYPLLSLCALAREGRVSVAASGAFDYPTWAEAAPGELSAAAFPRFRGDMRGSAEYRASLFTQALEKIREQLS